MYPDPAIDAPGVGADAPLPSHRRPRPRPPSPTGDGGAEPRAPPRRREEARQQAAARLGKRVLRPGGRELTEHLVTMLDVDPPNASGAAPGMGQTSRVHRRQPAFVHRGGARSGAAADRAPWGPYGGGVSRDRPSTPSRRRSATVVVGEAMLTCRTTPTGAIVASLPAVAPGGLYGIHERALVPADIPEEAEHELCADCRATPTSSTRPRGRAWRQLLSDAGLG